MDNREQAIRNAMQFAQSPAGQQLVKILRESNDPEVSSALEKLSAGDFSQVRKLLAVLMAHPEAGNFLRQLGGSDGQHGR